MFVPREMFLTKGVGRHREKLASFEEALRDAGIAAMNLVCVSSIFPPQCKIIPREKGLKKLKAGQIAFCVMARSDTDEHRRLVASSVGVAIPKDPSQYGYLSEHHSHGETGPQSSEYAEDLAASMLATTLGVEFDPDKAWDERRQVFRMSGRIVRTRAVTAAASGQKGVWTTTLACAVLLP